MTPHIPEKKPLYTIGPDGVKRQITKKSSPKQARSIPHHFYSIGFYLLTPLILGVIIGLFLRDQLGMPNLVVPIMIILGGGISGYHLYKIVKDDAAPHQH